MDKHTESGKHYEFGQTLEEIRRSLWRELDYRQEACNLNALGANLLEFSRILVPTPIQDFTTSRVLTAVSDGRGEDAAGIAIKISEPKEDFSENAFRQSVAALVSEHQGSKLDQIQVGRVVLEIKQISCDNGLRVPEELTLLAKCC